MNSNHSSNVSLGNSFNTIPSNAARRTTTLGMVSYNPLEMINFTVITAANQTSGLYQTSSLKHVKLKYMQGKMQQKQDGYQTYYYANAYTYKQSRQRDMVSLRK
jgi:hypothetical protein